MRISTLAAASLALLIVGVPARGDERGAGRLVPLEGLTLPRVGTLGEAPTGADVLIVQIERDGSIHVDGDGPLGLNELDLTLRRATDAPGARNEDGTSRRELLVMADGAVPWVVTQWVLMTAAHPVIGIDRIHFAARPQEGNAVGAIACPLPHDRARTGKEQGIPRLGITLSTAHELPASDVAALFPELTAQTRPLRGAGSVHFEIRTPPPLGPRVATRHVIETLDVLARAGARTVTLSGVPLPVGDSQSTIDRLRRKTAEMRTGDRGCRVRLGETLIGSLSPTTAVPEAQGLVPRAYGFLDPTSALLGVEEEAEPPSGTAPNEEADDEASPGEVSSSFRARLRTEDRLSSPDGRTRAIDDALRWLAAHQADHGGWEAAHFGRWCDGKRTTASSDGAGKAEFDVGVTGLALLAFHGAGYGPRGTHPYTRVAKAGLRRLKQVQDVDGCFGPRTTQHFVYNHAIATMAMVEAYGMTLSPLFKRSAQAGLDFLAFARNPYFAWRYGIKPGDNDTSVTAWAIAALDMARVLNLDASREGRPAPFEIDEACFDGAHAWLTKMTEPEYGRTGYIQRGGSPARSQGVIDRFPADLSEAMTAAAIGIRVALGESATKSLIIRKGAKLLEATKPAWNTERGSIDMIHWYFGTLATHRIGGTAWSSWRRALERCAAPPPAARWPGVRAQGVLGPRRALGSRTGVASTRRP